MEIDLCLLSRGTHYHVAAGCAHSIEDHGSVCPFGPDHADPADYPVCGTIEDPAPFHRHRSRHGAGRKSLHTPTHSGADR